MQNDNQPNPDIATTNSGSPIQPPTMVRGTKVIQPSPGLAEELQAQRQQEAASRPVPQPPVQQPTQSTQTEPAYGLGRSVDPSKIYPDITPTTAPTNTAPNTNQNEAKPANNQRVGTRVPSVRVYAFLIITYSAYSLIALSSIFHTTRVLTTNGRITTAGTYSLGSPLQLLILGIAAINIAVGIYLLIAKNIKTVNALLTTLLIIGGLGFLNSLVATVQSISNVTASTIVSLFISGGLVMYLWNVKSSVDLARID